MTCKFMQISLTELQIVMHTLVITNVNTHGWSRYKGLQAKENEQKWLFNRTLTPSTETLN